jgi:hypothetical protein
LALLIPLFAMKSPKEKQYYRMSLEQEVAYGNEIINAFGEYYAKLNNKGVLYPGEFENMPPLLRQILVDNEIVCAENVYDDVLHQVEEIEKIQ